MKTLNELWHLDRNDQALHIGFGLTRERAVELGKLMEEAVEANGKEIISMLPIVQIDTFGFLARLRDAMNQWQPVNDREVAYGLMNVGIVFGDWKVKMELLLEKIAAAGGQKPTKEEMDEAIQKMRDKLKGEFKRKIDQNSN